MKHANSKYTPIEKRILKKLMNARGSPVSRRDLLSVITREKHHRPISLVTVYLYRIRQKRKGAGKIVNIRSVGYALRRKIRGKPMRGMNAYEKRLFKFFQESDGKIVTTVDVAKFIGTKALTERARFGSAHAWVGRLRKVLPLEYEIITIRHLGYSFRTKRKKPNLSESVTTGEYQHEA